MSTVIDKTLELAAPPVLPEGLEEEHDRLDTLRSRLLPVEQAARAEIDGRIAQLVLTRERSGFEFPMLSFEPLLWRYPADNSRRVKGTAQRFALPKLALIDVAARDGVLSVRGEIDAWGRQEAKVSPVMPGPLASCYDDVGRSLARACERNEALTVSFAFTGLVPAKTRDVIADARLDPRFGQVFLLCEAPHESWSLSRETLPDLSDPLVVGYAAEALWVLDRFDPTSLEQYVAEEFASG